MGKMLRTLEDYYNLSVYMQGETAPPSKLLSGLIAEHGEGRTVAKTEAEMMYFIMNYERAEPGSIDTKLV
jgi:hypothetical protein